MKLNFSHPINDFLYLFSPSLSTPEEIEERTKRTIQQRDWIIMRYQIKQKMEKMIRKVSKARKLYRKYPTDLFLNNLNEKEFQYRELYNTY